MVGSWVPHNDSGNIWFYDGWILAKCSEGYKRDTFRFHGVFHEILVPKQVSYTFEYKGSPGDVTIEKVEFHDLGTQTKISGVSVLPSFPDPDGSVLADMREGTIISMNRFQALIQDL